MNEGRKTGIFWCVALVTLAVGVSVAWRPTSDDGEVVAGTIMFPEFTDPLAASSMKIVTFDEEKGTLATFEVRKDRETGLWTIPSRGGYPADAVQQMTDAANALVNLKILDVQTSNAEDHDDLGVAEPKLEDLEIGDEGVGRLVTFKDDSQNTLASLIIGDKTKDSDEQLYVRIPGQDPVYVVKLDEAPLTTTFQDWIEKDLLQLSSIDIQDIEVKDYNSSINLGGQVSLDRNYDATFNHDGTDWTLTSLMEYTSDNPFAPPVPVTPPADEELNDSRLNEMKNALDDLKIADVGRKPEGMSATLRADQDLLTDKDAVSSLLQRGFFPIQSGAEYDILSANGEMTVGLKDGVQYVMRFGNISGVSDDEAAAEEGDAAGGVNRYLLVMAQLDESKIPVPDLQKVPETLADLKAMLEPEAESPAADAAEEPVAEPKEPAAEKPADNESDAAGDEESPAATEPAAAKEPAATEAGNDEPSTQEPPANASEAAPDPASDDAVSETPDAEVPDAEVPDAEVPDAEVPDAEVPDAEASESGQTEGSGGGEATGSGPGLQQEASDNSDSQESGDQPASDESAAASDDAKEPSSEVSSQQPADESTTEPESVDADAPKAAAQAEAAAPKSEWDSMTDEEKQERLEAEQEKITKENQRKMDERKDKLEAAKRRVRELNQRFADWYYVIAEDTYAKLRIGRDELFIKPGADAAPPQGFPQPGSGGPSFLPNFPGAPGN